MDCSTPTTPVKNISEENDELWLFLTIFAWNFRILLWLLCTQVFYYFAPAFSLVVKLYDFGLIKNSNRFIRGSNPRFDYDFVLFYVHKARLPKQRTALQSAPWLLILFLLIIFLFSLVFLKFIYSEKATQFCEDLTVTTQDKSTVWPSHNI